MKHRLLYFPVLLVAAFALLPGLSSCKKVVRPTTVWIPDSVRHYYAVVSGEKVNMTWLVRNTGEEPLVITDIQPSGSVDFNDKEHERRIIPPGGRQRLAFTFNSDKNIGYVRSVIRLFGNIAPMGVCSMVFDINVVPRADYVPDYEEVYSKQKQSLGSKANEGDENGKGYYVDEDGDSGEKPTGWGNSTH